MPIELRDTLTSDYLDAQGNRGTLLSFGDVNKPVAVAGASLTDAQWRDSVAFTVSGRTSVNVASTAQSGYRLFDLSALADGTDFTVNIGSTALTFQKTATASGFLLYKGTGAEGFVVGGASGGASFVGITGISETVDNQNRRITLTLTKSDGSTEDLLIDLPAGTALPPPASQSEVDTPTGTAVRLFTPEQIDEIATKAGVQTYDSSATYTNGDWVRFGNEVWFYSGTQPITGTNPGEAFGWVRLDNQITVYTQGDSYRTGSLVSYSGSIWLCEQPNVGPPVAGPNWVRLTENAAVETDGVHILGDGTTGDPLRLSNPFTSDQRTKLADIEDNATADQTQAELQARLGKLTDSEIDAGTATDAKLVDARGLQRAVQQHAPQPSDGGLTTVHTDDSISGSGTQAMPLSVSAQAWNNATRYPAGTTVSHANQVWICVTQSGDNTNLTPGTDAAQQHWASVQTSNMQAWQPTVSYRFGSVVTHSSAIWISNNNANLNNEPTTSGQGGWLRASDYRLATDADIDATSGGTEPVSLTPAKLRRAVSKHETLAYPIWVSSNTVRYSVGDYVRYQDTSTNDWDVYMLTEALTDSESTDTAANFPINSAKWLRLNKTVKAWSGIQFHVGDVVTHSNAVWVAIADTAATNEPEATSNVWKRIDNTAGGLSAVAVEGRSDLTGPFVYIQGDGTSGSPLGIRKATVRTAIGSVVADEAQGTFNDSSTLGLVSGRALDNALDGKLGTVATGDTIDGTGVDTANQLQVNTDAVKADIGTITQADIDGDDTTPKLTTGAQLAGLNNTGSAQQATVQEIADGTEPTIRSYSPQRLNAGVDAIITGSGLLSAVVTDTSIDGDGTTATPLTINGAELRNRLGELDATEIADGSATIPELVSASVMKTAIETHGGEDNPADGTVAELTAGTETGNKSWSPATLKTWGDTLGGTGGGTGGGGTPTGFAPLVETQVGQASVNITGIQNFQDTGINISQTDGELVFNIDVGNSADNPDHNGNVLELRTTVASWRRLHASGPTDSTTGHDNQHFTLLRGTGDTTQEYYIGRSSANNVLVASSSLTTDFTPITVYHLQHRAVIAGETDGFAEPVLTLIGSDNVSSPSANDWGVSTILVPNDTDGELIFRFDIDRFPTSTSFNQYPYLRMLASEFLALPEIDPAVSALSASGQPDNSIVPFLIGGSTSNPSNLVGYIGRGANNAVCYASGLSNTNYDAQPLAVYNLKYRAVIGGGGTDANAVQKRGDWSSTETYNQTDIVVSHDSLFTANKDVPAGLEAPHLHTDGEYWVPYVEFVTWPEAGSGDTITLTRGQQTEVDGRLYIFKGNVPETFNENQDPADPTDAIGHLFHFIGLPATVSEAEIDAGSGVSPRTWTVDRVKYAVDNLGSSTGGLTTTELFSETVSTGQDSFAMVPNSSGWTTHDMLQLHLDAGTAGTDQNVSLKTILVSELKDLTASSAGDTLAESHQFFRITVSRIAGTGDYSPAGASSVYVARDADNNLLITKPNDAETLIVKGFGLTFHAGRGTANITADALAAGTSTETGPVSPSLLNTGLREERIIVRDENIILNASQRGKVIFPFGNSEFINDTPSGTGHKWSRYDKLRFTVFFDYDPAVHTSRVASLHESVLETEEMRAYRIAEMNPLFSTDEPEDAHNVQATFVANDGHFNWAGHNTSGSTYVLGMSQLLNRGWYLGRTFLPRVEGTDNRSRYVDTFLTKVQTGTYCRFGFLFIPRVVQNSEGSNHVTARAESIYGQAVGTGDMPTDVMVNRMEVWAYRHGFQHQTHTVNWRAGLGE